MKRNKLILFIVILIFFSVAWLIPDEKTVKYSVNYDALNFRSGPGTGYQILGVLVRGDLLELLKKSEAWLKVKCLTGKLKGVEGFLHKKYVQLVSPTAKSVSSSKNKIKIGKAPKITQTQRLSNPDPGDSEMIARIQKKMLSQSLLFLGLIKQMEPKLTDSEVTVKRIPKVKVIKRNALVLDGFVSGSRVIHYPYINEPFTVDEDGDDFFKIRLSGRRTGWIHKSFVQNYHENETRPVVKFNGIHKNEVSRLLDQLAEQNNLIGGGKKVADSIMSKYDLEKIQNTPIITHYKKINKYYRYTKKFYEKFRIEENIVFYGSKESLLTKLRLWGEIMLGTESTKTLYAGNTIPEKTGGGKHTLSIGAEYRVNRDLNLSLNYSSKKEVMLETFTNTNFNGEIRYSGVDDLDLAFRGGYNSYGSPDNIRADFNQLNLGTNLKYQLSESSDVTFNYNLNNYTYSNDAANNYSIHSMVGGFASRVSAKAILLLNLLFETESGDLSNHNFTHLKPYFSYTVRKENKFFRTRFLLDKFTFAQSTSNNYSKLFGELGFGNNQKEFTIGGFSKNYPENEIADYLRLMLRVTGNSRDYKKRTSFSVYSSLFTQDQSMSYTDLHFETSSLGKAMVTSFNILFKYWHSPGDEGLGEIVKPHVLDLYCKFGFNFKYLMIGPVVGVHGNIAFNDSSDLFERDGNLLRFGGFADLNMPLSDKLKIIGHGTFEYGNVFTNNYTGFNDRTGDITIDGVYLRHPTTLHINASAHYQLNSSINLFARGGYYQVDTGFELIPGMYPVEQNSRFYMFGGATFRLN